MEEKCSKCGKLKEAEEFRKDSRMKSGLRSQCRQCESEYAAQFRKDNPEKAKESKAKYRASEKGRKKDKEWANNNKELRRESKKKYRSQEWVKIQEAEYKKKYREEHKEEIAAYNKQKYWDDPEFHREKTRIYRRENPEKTKESIKRYRKDKFENDPIYRRKAKFRRKLYKWVTRRGSKKIGSTELVIGCTFDEFFNRVESLFLVGMTWDNYGKLWDFDHIIPISYAITEDEVNYLNHYTNLKPMYSEENRYVKRDDVFYNEYDLDYVISEWI